MKKNFIFLSTLVFFLVFIPTPTKTAYAAPVYDFIEVIEYEDEIEEFTLQGLTVWLERAAFQGSGFVSVANGLFPDRHFEIQAYIRVGHIAVNHSGWHSGFGHRQVRSGESIMPAISPGGSIRNLR